MKITNVYNHAYFLLPPSTWVKRKHIRIHRWLIVKKRLPSPSSTHTILTFCVHCLYMQAKVDDRSLSELLIESNDYQLYSSFKNQVKCLGCIFGGFWLIFLWWKNVGFHVGLKNKANNHARLRRKQKYRSNPLVPEQFLCF